MRPISIEASPPDEIKRTAVDTSGSLGSLYDGYRDQMVIYSNKKEMNKRSQSHKNTVCKIVKGDTNESQYLPQVIGIPDDVRLSMLLNLTSRSELMSLADYPHRIDEHTRILHYTYTHSEQKGSVKPKKAKRQLESLISQTRATHIVTGVTWGILLVAVFQLSSDDEVTVEIDDILETVTKALLDGDESLVLNPDEIDKLEKGTSMKVYSNIPTLARATSLNEIYVKVPYVKGNKLEHRPVDYHLRLVQNVYTNLPGTIQNFASLDAACSNKVEQRLLRLSYSLKYVESFSDANRSSLLHRHLKGQLHDIYAKLQSAKKIYKDELERFAMLLIGCRRADTTPSQIEEALSDAKQRTLGTRIDELAKESEDLEAKGRLIKELYDLKFQYCDISTYASNQGVNEQTVEQLLVRDDPLVRVLCSSDTLNKDKAAEFIKLRKQLVKELKNNPTLRLIYADFSYSHTFQLSDVIIKPLSLPADDTINILLVGESGVGKSTFINAFVNYLTYDTLADAEFHEPVVLIPVSFLITTGREFAEHTVKFGDFEKNYKNEDFDHPGQSVTQHCQSYLFHLKNDPGKKIRIIDTPGFGDTRGVDQDDRNMQHILEYIHSFPHLNAVCFLLKPNVSRLNGYFPMCFTQLSELLGRNAYRNIIFCFTSTRSTFYAPGDTTPLLRTMLRSLSVDTSILKKANVFCFDSEAFRYLVALKNTVKFDDLDRTEYEKSWNTSVQESHRLIEKVCNNPNADRICMQRKSLQYARVEIIHMIRPLMETIRNNLRNSILLEDKSVAALIKLCPQVINHPTTLCPSCHRRSEEIANFSILSHCLNERSVCKCSPNQCIPIDYILKYEVSKTSSNDDRNEVLDRVSLLLNACIEFSRFLLSTAYSPQDDLFLAALIQMIDEEKKICSDKSKQLNAKLLEKLRELKKEYERRTENRHLNRDEIQVPIIYERIQITCDYLDIREQMKAIRDEKKSMIQSYEHKVPDSPTILPAIDSGRSASSCTTNTDF